MAARLLTLLMMLLSLGQGTVDAYVEEMNLGGCLFLVNRDYPIAADYVPPDLVKVRVSAVNSDVSMRAEAAQALADLFAAAREEGGYQLVAVSGYRSYGQQASIHERKVKSAGKKAALRLSAPPGCSEHQLGLAMDLGCKETTALTERFGQMPEGRWVAENCHRFGFIFRYPADKTALTGVKYEPWHIRYVGEELAPAVHESGLCWEEFLAGRQ